MSAQKVRCLEEMRQEAEADESFKELASRRGSV
jgi:hypothetical protein